ncbi:hypothetical protein GQ43DRAFT_32983 [Delitschia confertaspora ATCC 74209]|uniref:Uncharacterized protein n=1 Tax=Delitschia confertaspora ATCC 74209 TaxID=1513339 RepID=A0A9P4MZ64_9PLEO|nr:hypothetical protein GQ43DRAFT_32983 [Delitschia confertaspora ATCC 74209]
MMKSAKRKIRSYDWRWYVWWQGHFSSRERKKQPDDMRIVNLNRTINVRFRVLIAVWWEERHVKGVVLGKSKGDNAVRPPRTKPGSAADGPSELWARMKKRNLLSRSSDRSCSHYFRGRTGEANLADAGCCSAGVVHEKEKVAINKGKRKKTGSRIRDIY